MAFTEVLTTFGANKVSYIKVPGIGTAGLDDVLGTTSDPGAVMKRIIGRARSKLPRRPAAKRSASKTASYSSAVHAHLHTPGSPAETRDEPSHGPGSCECTSPALAHETNILDRLAAAAKVLGMAGEVGNAKLIYLSVASQILEDPVSVAMKGLSSVGKSFTTQTVIRFFPEDAVIILTGMSERGLVYMERDFSHRTVVLYEAVALREGREKNEGNQTAYYIRSLMSEGCIRYVVTVKDEGGSLVGKEILKPGPTNFVITTTSASLHNENETRMLSLAADDSKEQTRRIFKAIAAGKRRERDLGDWHAYYQWIRTCAEHRVVIPYVDHLADNMAADSVRLRRDFTVLLQLIEINAILHQRNRARDEQGRIVATACDYLTVRNLIADLISTTVGASVPASVRQTVEAVAELAGKDGESGDVTVKMLAERLCVERSVAQRRLTTARNRGYVVNMEEHQGKPARYRTGDPLPGDHAVLPADLPDEHVCTHDGSVYNGLVTCLDWRKGRILDKPKPCVLCGKKTLLIEPYDSRPCHKPRAAYCTSSGRFVWN
jgi:hypothetical protein